VLVNLIGWVKAGGPVERLTPLVATEERPDYPLAILLVTLKL